jgi:hypothetical protein
LVLLPRSRPPQSRGEQVRISQVTGPEGGRCKTFLWRSTTNQDNETLVEQREEVRLAVQRKIDSPTLAADLSPSQPWLTKFFGADDNIHVTQDGGVVVSISQKFRQVLEVVRDVFWPTAGVYTQDRYVTNTNRPTKLSEIRMGAKADVQKAMEELGVGRDWLEVKELFDTAEERYMALAMVRTRIHDICILESNILS